MSIQGPSGNTKEAENVSKRVKNTKKEIEMLKAELEKLIQLGPNNSKHDLLKELKENPSQTCQPIMTETIDNQPRPTGSKPNADVTVKKMTAAKEVKPSPKKIRNYNVAEAREYIKKQREKRTEQLKAQINVTDNRLDMKKQKLKELHQKTLELVTKNVQLKRERSKSRDRIAQVRPDRNKQSSRAPSKSSQKIIQKSVKAAPQDAVEQNLLSKSSEKTHHVRDRVSRSKTRSTSESKLKQAPAPEATEPDLSGSKKTQAIIDTEIEKTAIPFSGLKIGATSDKELGFHNKINHKAYDAIITEVCAKLTKETQTNRENGFAKPTWLQPQPTLPYPYNFINTVKRKLQFAINSPRNCVDVGVQNSEILKSKEEIKELLIESTSKKNSGRPNLDLKLVENLELIPKSGKIETVSKSLFDSYESESDTSKNIPEISSESIESKRNDSEPKLSLGRLKELRLDAHITSRLGTLSQSDVKTDTNGYPQWGESYNSGFLKETKSESIKTVASQRKQATYVNDSVKSDHLTIHTREDDTFESGETLKSLLTDGQVSKSATEPVSEIVSEISTVGESERSLALKEPTGSLTVKKNGSSLEVVDNKLKNVTLRPILTTNNNVNEIHLKFEAEVRLLNDFNESLKQFMTVEKAFEHLKTKNESDVTITKKILQNVDTQTSVVTKTSTNVTTADRSRDDRNSFINFSRGSEINEDLNDSLVNTNNNNNNMSRSFLNSSFSTEWNLSNLIGSSNTNMSTTDEHSVLKLSMSNVENYDVKNCAGISLNMFEQLIKDEDARIQHLKAIIKIREQALLDRTKGELVWLAIQKKQLVETGKIEEASLLKKKQRGIILKHEQERNEIKKLKQMQKEASEERKNILKQQRNLIKSQLSTKTMLSKIKVKTPRERRSLGPLRVVQSCSESIHSETSMSRKSSGLDEVLSATTFSIESDFDFSSVRRDASKTKVPVSNVKRTLFMREAALQKRRKAAEELLRWHRKLLDEERKIAELEAAATSVISRIPKQEEVQARYKFTGKQLNQLWRNMTGRDDRKFVEDKVYVMSQVTLERLCKSARQYANKNKKTHPKNSDLSSVISDVSDSGSEPAKKSGSDANYSSFFDAESVQDIINSQEENTKISSISELIDNFSKIEDEISLLSRKSEHDITSLKEFDKTVEGSEISEDLNDTVLPPASVIEELVEVEHLPSVVENVSNYEVIEELVDVEHVSSAVENVSKYEVPSEETPDDDKLSQTIHEESDELKTELNLQEEIEEISPVEDSKTTNSTPIEKDEDVVTDDCQKSEIITESSDSAASVSSKIVYQLKQSESVREDLDLEEALETASKIEESLNNLNKKLTGDGKEEISEDLSTLKEVQSLELSEDKENEKDGDETSQSSSNKNSSPEEKIDVKKRVSEILADANGPSRQDKSPRLQDLYVTAYDVGSSTSPESIESVEDGRQLPTSIFGSEAEELWRKQLAIEQEIKQLELQQKEQLPYVFMREIPNKPPPPYTPPSSLSSLPHSIVPTTVKEINEITNYSSKVIYKAYQNNNLEKSKFSENSFKLFSKVEVTKMCGEFLFNICKDVARDHYKRFEKMNEPSWLMVTKKPQLAKLKPSDAVGLERIMNQKLKELFGFKKLRVTESAIVKWGRKKRDHVDEILVVESQEEESQWTNFDSDELIVKDQITAELIKMLLDETASVFSKVFSKKNSAVS